MRKKVLTSLLLAGCCYFGSNVYALTFNENACLMGEICKRLVDAGIGMTYLDGYIYDATDQGKGYAVYIDSAMVYQEDAGFYNVYAFLDENLTGQQSGVLKDGEFDKLFADFVDCKQQKITAEAVHIYLDEAYGEDTLGDETKVDEDTDQSPAAQNYERYIKEQERKEQKKKTVSSSGSSNYVKRSNSGSGSTKQGNGFGYSKKKSYSRSYDSYDEGYDAIAEDEDYDWDRYCSDQDYADGVDDAMEDYEEDW